MLVYVTLLSLLCNKPISNRSEDPFLMSKLAMKDPFAMDDIRISECGDPSNGL